MSYKRASSRQSGSDGDSLTIWLRAGAAAGGLILALSAGLFSTHVVSGQVQTSIQNTAIGVQAFVS